MQLRACHFEIGFRLFTLIGRVKSTPFHGSCVAHAPETHGQKDPRLERKNKKIEWISDVKSIDPYHRYFLESISIHTFLWYPYPYRYL